jgi:hypothetical protein
MHDRIHALVLSPTFASTITYLRQELVSLTTIEKFLSVKKEKKTLQIKKKQLQDRGVPNRTTGGYIE